MNSDSIIPNNNLEPYVRSILLLENDLKDTNTLLPFFADGYPGVIFQIATNGVYLKPKNKKLSDFFLYGQTIHPIELSIKGSFKLIIFQLYPHVAKYLFGVNPKELNDDCFDLCSLQQLNVHHIVEQLKNNTHTKFQIEIISAFLVNRIKLAAKNSDDRIRLAINCIINNRGKIFIKDLREQLHITERTFERQFVSQIGVSPKQFAKIIQFQFSLNQLSDDDYSRLTDIVFDNGYADQSHFIRTFKKYTGKTPAEFQK